MIIILSIAGIIAAVILIKLWLAFVRLLFGGTQTENKYIQKHRLKVKNDNEYKSYLKWCSKVNEIPMDKEIYLKDVERREQELKRMI